MRVSNQVFIDQPVDDVFAYVSNLNNYADWATGVLDLHADTEDIGAFVLLRQLSGRRIEARFKVTELIPKRRIVLQGRVIGARWTSTITFDEGRGGGTQVREVTEVRFEGLARFASPLVTRLLGRSGRADLAGLKRCVEVTASVAAGSLVTNSSDRAFWSHRHIEGFWT